jgi:hypothetical protein
MNFGKIGCNLCMMLAAISIVFLLGCGGIGNSASAGQPQNDPPPTSSVPPLTSAGISVSVSPGSASVEVGGTTQFTATVQNDPGNRGVSWAMPAGCSVQNCGSIDSNGLFTAPAVPHTAPGLLITATSVSDSTKSANAWVYINPAPTGIAVSPGIVTVPDGGTQMFVAIGIPSSGTPVVEWTVSGSGCGGVTCGTINANGMYQAPSTPPNPPSVLVTATYLADSSVTGSAVVMVGSNPNNSKLKGTYAFLVSGYDGDGAVEMAGSFVADGNGNITSGLSDINFSSDIYVATNLSFSGTYSVGGDNRASMNIFEIGTNSLRSGFTQAFAFALNSFASGVANRGQIIELDGEEIWATGVLAKQDPAAFSTASVSGDYAFGLSGSSDTGWPLAANGRFTANGGSITAGLSDVYGLGLSEGGQGTVIPLVNTPFTGSYQVSPNGRGTLALSGSTGFSNFSFYVVSPGELFLLEIDGCTGDTICRLKAGISGSALQQTGGPFTNNSLKGTSVFNLTAAGANTGIGSVAVGVETFDGTGGLVGTKYENNAGVVTVGAALAGQYTMDSNGLGRGLFTLSGDTHPKPFYLVSPGKGFVIDSNSMVAGSFETQTNGPFGNESISGDYVLGSLPWSFNWVFDPSVGVVTADGNGNLTGTSDGYDATNLTITGSYNMDASGKVSMLFTPRTGAATNWVFYLVSPSKALGIDVDAGITNKSIAIIEK